MPAAIHKALVYRLIEEGWNEGNLEVVAQMTAPGAVAHDGVLHHHHHGQPHEVGPEAGKHFVTAYRTAFPDLRFSVEEMVAEDDIVVTRWRASGTHRGELLGIDPTGRTATLRGTSVFRFDHAVIAESWANLDAEGLMHQLSA